MRKNKILIGVCLAAMVLLFAFAGNTLAQEAMTIVGTLNEDGDLVDQNGVVYLIDGGAISDEDALNSDATFEVNGIVEEDDSGDKWITIQNYKVIETEKSN